MAPSPWLLPGASGGGAGQPDGDRPRQTHLIGATPEESQLSRIGEELALDENGRHARLTQHHEVRGLDAAIPVRGECLEHSRQHLSSESSPSARTRKMEHLHAFDIRFRRGVGVDADEHIGRETVGEGGSRAQAEGAVAAARHHDAVATPLQLGLDQACQDQRQGLFRQQEWVTPHTTRIRAPMSCVDAQLHVRGSSKRRAGMRSAAIIVSHSDGMDGTSVPPAQ